MLDKMHTTFLKHLGIQQKGFLTNLVYIFFLLAPGNLILTNYTWKILNI